MKHDRTKRPASFITLCVTQLLLFSLVLVFTLVAINYYITFRMARMFPVLDDVLVYQNSLSRDAFDELPMRSFHNCSLMVLNEDYDVLYTTDRDLSESLKKTDIELIQSYQDNSSYTVLHYQNDDGQIYSMVAQYSEEKQSPESAKAMVSDFCRVDEKGFIVSGTLFPERTQLDQRELALLSGFYDPEHYIQRYSYLTIGGIERTLIFLSPLLDYAAYMQEFESAQRVWLLAVPLLLGIIALLTLLFTRQMKDALHPLSQAFVDYGQGKETPLEVDELPMEFREAGRSFLQMQSSLDQSRLAEERASADKQRILAGLSHDLKTPLTVIQGYSLALRDDVVPEQKRSQYLNVIYSRAKVMSGLLDSLLRYTRMERSDYILSPERVDLAEFCRNYLSEKYEEVTLGGFILDVDITEESVPCLIDRKLMNRALDNLIGNALRHNPRGTTLFFLLCADEEMVRISVADNGNTIDPKLKDTIFDAFVSGNEARTSGSGSGIGLSIVKRVAELHHGSVELLLPPETEFATEFVMEIPVQLGVRN